MFRYTANGSFIVKENFSQYTELSLNEFRQKRSENKIRLSTKPVKNTCLSFTDPQKCSEWKTDKTERHPETSELGFPPKQCHIHETELDLYLHRFLYKNDHCFPSAPRHGSCIHCSRAP